MNVETKASSCKKRSHSQIGSSSSSGSLLHIPDPLERVDLELTDEEHAIHDQQVLASSVLHHLIAHDTIDNVGAELLLFVIVENAGDLLDKTYSNSGRVGPLIRDTYGLSEELKAAWTTRKFAGIRSLAVLQPKVKKVVVEMEVDEGPSSAGRARILDLETQRNAISSAWNEPYTGHYHELLYENINNMERSKPYTNTVAIVQSSGTGKSRMVHEQSNLVFTIPFNLREEGENQDLAYPGPDRVVREYLTLYPSTSDITGLQAYYYDFLRYLFAKVREELTSLYDMLPTAATYPEVASAWRQYLESGARDKLYQSVVDTVSQSSTKHTKGDGKARLSQSQGKAKEELTALVSSLDKMVDSKARKDIKDRVKLVLYFDEAHILTNTRAPSNPDDKDLYSVLCSCFDFFVPSPIFVIYLSTNSRLDKFAPEGPMARSARARANADALQAPITEVPFDCAKDFFIRPGQYKLADVCTVEFMCNFGRPLFWTMLAGAGEKKQVILSTIIDFARAKLVRQHNIQDPLPNLARLAVCDVRLMLDFEPRREKLRGELLHAEAKLVASHMRIAYSVPQNRSYLRSGYPSEPLLAEAAAQQMFGFKAHSHSVVSTLHDYMHNGLLDRGERGEVVARTLVMAAYDRAVERENSQRDPGTPPLYSKGCGAITFIEELFSEDYASEILDSVPDNIKQDETLREAFKTAKVRFTHFVKWRDDSGMTTEAMCVAFIRAMAVVCHSGNATVDMALPVLLWDEFLCEEVMTGMLIQVKRRMKAGTVQAYSINAENLAFFPEASMGTERSRSRPYITLIMELGVQNALPPLTKILTKGHKSLSARNVALPKKSTKVETTQVTPSKVILTQQGRLRHSTATHPRYSIFAYGCSSTVYKVITPQEKYDYAFLLASRDFLAEHPRQTARSLHAVRKMKPFWAVGDECFHWYESDDLNVRQAQNADYEGCLVTGSGLESEDETGLVDEEDDDVFMRYDV